MPKLKDWSQCGNDNKYKLRAVLVICLCKFWKGMQSKIFPESSAEAIKILNDTHAVYEYTSHIQRF